MTRAPRIVDLAVAAAYHVGAGEDPLAGPGELVAGYHALNPLESSELDILLHLIGARLAMTVAITEWRAGLYPQNREHILKNNASSWVALERLRRVSPPDAAGHFATACGVESTRRGRTPSDRAGSTAESPKSLLERRKQLLGPAYRLFYDRPLHIVRGEGVWLYDSEGRAYLDAYNNVPHVGHCHPTIVSALCSQASVLNTHTRYLHETVLQYAERITAKVPAPSTVMFTCTGSEANDLAVRVARACTGNIGIIATAHAYHGNTLAVADFSPAYASAEKRSTHVLTVPAPDRFRRPSGVDDGSLGEGVRGACPCGDRVPAGARRRRRRLHRRFDVRERRHSGCPAGLSGGEVSSSCDAPAGSSSRMKCREASRERAKISGASNDST